MLIVPTTVYAIVMLTLSAHPLGTEVRFDVQDSVGRSSSSIPVIVGPGKPSVPLHVSHALITAVARLRQLHSYCLSFPTFDVLVACLDSLMMNSFCTHTNFL